MTRMGDSIRRRSGRGARPAPRPGAAGARPRGASRRPLRLWRWILGGLLAGALAFGVGYGVAVFVLFPKPALAGDEVAVPDLSGMTVDEARAALAGQQLGLGDVRAMNHATMQRGAVIAQDPIEGQRLRPGGAVRLAVSAGRARVSVPLLVGMPGDAAATLAERVGFEVEQRVEASDEPRGRVLGTVPRAGEQVELPARLVLVVSEGNVVPVDSIQTPTDSTFAPADDVPAPPNIVFPPERVE